MADGELVSREAVARYSSSFAARFGPDQLRALDGEPLLRLLHGREEGDECLCYWLEFKKDEATGLRFGGIGGGSALKFGLYQRNADDAWMTGSAMKQREITIDEAIEMARRQRDELVAGADVFAAFDASDPGDAAYARLQAEMEKAAPTLSDASWGRKYWFLLQPEKLDDFHSPVWQRFYLLKLLQIPPDGKGIRFKGERPGRFLCGGRFVRIARKLETTVAAADMVLSQLYGARHNYWRIGTRSGDDGADQWPVMLAGSHIAIGWSKLGSLTDYASGGKDGRTRLREDLERIYYDGKRSTAGIKANEIIRFVRKIEEGDIIVAADGSTVRGVGRVTGDYRHDPNLFFPNLRSVEWLDEEGGWQTPEHEGLRTTVHRLGKSPANTIAVERAIRGDKRSRPTPKPATTAPTQPRLPPLDPMEARIESVLDRKGQVILYGPPGTGKTYVALRTARELAARRSFKKTLRDLNDDELATLEGAEDAPGLVRLCTFHPAYGYEDFLEGFRPAIEDGTLVFRRASGVFRQLCVDASNAPDRPHFLVIDEINRGDIPRIFGELLTVLEADKRGLPILLPVSGKELRVPKNLFVVGTMNTADRSISLLDAALRRRFGFIEMMPDATVLGEAHVRDLPLGAWLEALNKRICAHLGRDARNLQVGHSYLMEGGRAISSLAKLTRVLRQDIIPLLQEYCYEDHRTLATILGESLIDAERMVVRDELFAPGRETDLLEALTTLFPDVSTSPKAIHAERATLEEDDDGDDDVSEDSETGDAPSTDHASQ